MIRRPPSRIELKPEDIEEYEENKKKKDNENGNKSY